MAVKGLGIVSLILLVAAFIFIGLYKTNSLRRHNNLVGNVGKICFGVAVLLISISVVIMKYNGFTENYLTLRQSYPEKFPKIVHLIYIPWDKNTGIIKEDEDDFDHTFYKDFSKNNPDWEVKMWTLSKINDFTDKFYPEYRDIWDKIKHPTQSVDFFRILVTYHYGGIYWQYGSTQNSELEDFIPAKNKDIKLFIETIITPEYANSMRNERIREGKPEELERIANQLFSAYPKNPFLKYCIEKYWNNLNNYTVKNQYDILYIGANAMFSEAYHEYKDKRRIELIYDTDIYITIYSTGSWRMQTYK